MDKSSHKILILEDETSTRQALIDKFNREGFEVLDAGDGESGLEIALKEHPDLILLDIIMPKKDGLTMLGELRQDKWGSQVPVLLLTNLSDSDKIAEAAKQGAYSYLVKSNWKLQDVVDAVRDKLEGKSIESHWEF